MLWFRALVCAVFVLALGLPPAAADEEPEVQTASGLSKPIYSQRITEDYWVTTPHGTIYGEVVRPVVPEGVKVPVILTYSPYGTLSKPHNDVEHTLSYEDYYVPRGYARAWFDLVGTRESSGCYDYGGIRERETGADIVDFLGTRSWSNGKVGMIGASYDGTTAISAAVEAPEHLTTIVPQVAIDRWYDYPYDGGVRRVSGYATPLAFDYAFGMTPATDKDNPQHAVATAADRAVPCDRLEHQVRGYQWDPIYDSFFDERDYRARAGNVKASVLVEGGWLDSNVQPIGGLRFFQALPDDHPKKMVMGQWGHGTPNSTIPDWNSVRHAWFDYWLLGYDGIDDADDLPDTGVMDLPRIDSGLPGGVRFQFDSWPPAGTQHVGLPLLGRAAATTREFGLASTDATYDTTDASISSSNIISGSCGDSCVRFLSAPLDEDVRLSGTPFLDLTAITNAKSPYSTHVSTQFGVYLFAVSESGQRTPLSNGWMNSRNRNGERTSEDVAPGDPYRGTVELADLDRVIPAGSRLGIGIASNAQLEVFPEDDGPVLNTIVVDPGTTSLRLPVSEGVSAFGG